MGAGVSFDSELNWLSVQGSLERILVKAKNPHRHSASEIAQEFARPGGGQIWQWLRAGGFVDDFVKHMTGAVKHQAPVETHEQLAKFVESKHVLLAVCYNWDDYIEQCCSSNLKIHVGSSNPRGIQPDLWKPHGTVRDNNPWVLPDEKTVFPPGVTRAVNDYDGPIVTITCGFSGAGNVNSTRLSKLGAVTFDIRPDLDVSVKTGDNQICLSAKVAFDWLNRNLK